MMAHYERAELIKHPVVISLVQCKWKNFGRSSLLVQFLFYSVFLTILTLYTIYSAPVNSLFYIDDDYKPFWMPTKCKGPDSNWTLSADITELENREVCNAVQQRHTNSSFDCIGSSVGLSHNTSWLHIDQIALCILSFIMLLGYLPLTMVLRTFTNFIAIAVFVFTILLTAPRLPWNTPDCFYTYGLQGSVKWQLSAVNILLGFIHIALMLEYAPSIGLYVIMLKRVSKTMLRALAVPFGFVVCSLAFSLHVIFKASVRHQQRHRDFGENEFPDTANQWPLNPFYTIPQSFSKTLLMFVGEYDMETHFKRTNLSATWWILMLLIMFGTIATMNLLTGLAVGEIGELQAKAEYEQLKKQIMYVLGVERIIRMLRLTSYSDTVKTLVGTCFKSVLAENDQLEKTLTLTSSADIFNLNPSRKKHKLWLSFVCVVNRLFAAGNKLLSTNNRVEALWELEITNSGKTKNSTDKENLVAADIKHEISEIKAMIAQLANQRGAQRSRRMRSLP